VVRQDCRLLPPLRKSDPEHSYYYARPFRLFHSRYYPPTGKMDRAGREQYSPEDKGHDHKKPAALQKGPGARFTADRRIGTVDKAPAFCTAGNYYTGRCARESGYGGPANPCSGFMEPHPWRFCLLFQDVF